MDFSKWAVVSYKDDTGLGAQASYLRAVLSLGRQLVVPSIRVPGHPLDRLSEVPLLPGCSENELGEALEGIDGVILLEREFDKRIMPVAKARGIKIVCLPNWEWFLGTYENWKLCDLFVCPSQFCLQLVQNYGYRNTACIPPALDLSRFPARKVTGQARYFIHNAGLVDEDDRKGTRDTILAFKRVRRSDIRLNVRLQKEADLPPLDGRIKVEVGNLENQADLYAQGDVAVQPSKMEGVGFMVLEPLCTGLPVITLDYPPMNEFVQSKELLVRKLWFKRKSFASQWIPHAHLRLPDIKDLARKIEWCADNDLASISQLNRNFAEQTFDRETIRQQWIRALDSVF